MRHPVGQKKIQLYFRTLPASTKNAINLNKLAALVGDNDEDLDLDLLAKVKESRDFAVLLDVEFQVQVYKIIQISARRQKEI